MGNGDGSDFSAVEGTAALIDGEHEDATKIAPVPIFPDRVYQDIDTKFDTMGYQSWTVLPHGCSRRKSLLIALKLIEPQMLRTTIPSRSWSSGALGK